MEIRAIGILSNAMSTRLMGDFLARRRIDPRTVGLIVHRNVAVSWTEQCAEFINGVSQADNARLHRAAATLRFYRRAARRLRFWLKGGAVDRVFISNVDNVLSNHCVQERREGAKFTVSVVVEGLLNFQNIDALHRPRWSWPARSLLAHSLGLKYSKPSGHLSGAFEPEVSEVISFSLRGLKAPADKAIAMPLPQFTPDFPADKSAALIVATGISQWMRPSDFRKFASAFGAWIASESFDRIIVKPHPVFGLGGIESYLPPHSLLQDTRPLEEIAGCIPAGTVIGFCTTGLVTLKHMRPDLSYLDYGSDFYCTHAYRGDTSVVDVLKNAGIDLVLLSGIRAA